MSVRKLDVRELAYRQGQKMYEQGEPCPENIWNDEQWRDGLVPGQCRWLGWMLARGTKILAEDKHQRAVRDYLERGIDLPPDFR